METRRCSFAGIVILKRPTGCETMFLPFVFTGSTRDSISWPAAGMRLSLTPSCANERRIATQEITHVTISGANVDFPLFLVFAIVPLIVNLPLF
jgi:hypothetical protein